MQKSNEINTINEQIKSMLANGFNNDALKEKVEEYIEISKLKLKIAKEILELSKENSKTKDYLSDLENDLIIAEKELANNKALDIILDANE